MMKRPNLLKKNVFHTFVKPSCRDDRRYWLVYDGRCGFCRGWVRLIERLDLLGRVRPLDLHTQAERVLRRAPGLDRDGLMKAVHLLSPAGEVWAGFEAVRMLARLVPPLWPTLPALHAPGASRAGPILYEWTSRNRHRLSVCGPGGVCPAHSERA